MIAYLKKEWLSWVKLLVVAVIAGLLMHTYGFNLTLVQGQSMLPTLQQGDRLLINRAVYVWQEPKLHEVVILQEPDVDGWRDPFLVKRIVAVAGDEVEIRTGSLYRNGVRTMEMYTDTRIEDGDWGPMTVTPGHFFVMGDNRHFGSSRDSRSFGQVPRTNIVGRVEYTLWPGERAGSVK